MKDLLYKILFFNTIAVLILFLIQTVTGYVTFEPLNGVTTETEKPKLTLKSYLDGSFQNNIENYCTEHFGFRECLIRHYNQYLWDCFGETNNATVVRGKGNWLFEEVHVKDHYESLMYNYTNDTAEMKETFETEALRLWKVQKLLKEYNIHIFVVINPSKNVIFPEYLPKNTIYYRPEGLRAYDYYKKRFNELGINYLDFVPVFKNLKDSVDYQLFPETGTHWTNIASAFAYDSIIRYMEIIGNQDLINTKISEKYRAETREPDNDLEKILNLSRPIKSPPNMYVDVYVERDSTVAKPYLTVIGDSYYWNILNNMPLWETFRSFPYWYYNSTVHDEEGHTSTLELDLEKELMRTDYIMLIYNTLSLYEFGSCFLQRALLHLCYDQETIDFFVKRVIGRIKADPNFYANVKKEAKAKQVSEEQLLYEYGIYMLKINPEKYIEELQGDKMPISRNKNLKRIPPTNTKH